MRAAILLVDRCFGGSVHSSIDTLIAANYTLLKSGTPPIFEWDLVSLSDRPVLPTNRLAIQADYSLENYLASDRNPDVWFIPAVFQSSSDYERIQQSMAMLRPMIQVLQNHHEQGGLTVSVCSGAFLLAASGLLNNRPALMHWKGESHFRRMFPKHPIDTHNTIADYGNILCAIGGSRGYEYVILHLIRRFAGHDIALNTAKLLMVDLNPPASAPYRAAVETYDHQDELVRKAQRIIEKKSAESLQSSNMAEELAISERQLKRRFEKALGCTPTQYLQKVRINRACNLLSATRAPSSKIIFDIGYQDESSFRRLFKKHMGMTMEAYRQEFGVTKADKIL